MRTLCTLRTNRFKSSAGIDLSCTQFKVICVPLRTFQLVLGLNAM